LGVYNSMAENLNYKRINLIYKRYIHNLF